MGFRATHQTSGLPGYPAIDVFAPIGALVLAGFYGIIERVSGHPPTYAGTPGGAYGWSLYVHNRANGYRRFVTHLGSLNVKVGDRVAPGTVLGTVARPPAGSVAGSSHVHLGLNRP